MWKLALHSVSYAGVWPGQASLPLEGFLDRAADLGFEGVMLMAKRGHASLLEMDPDRRQAVRDQLRRRGLELAAIASYTNFTAGADRPDIPIQEMQILYVRECARLARDLGGGIVRIFTGYECAELTPAQSWQRCVQAIRECGRAAAEFGVTIAVQNHHDIAVNHTAMRDLLEEVAVPNVKAGFDAWAPTLQGLSGDELADAVRSMAPYIAQTIVADYIRQPRFRYHPALTNYTREPDNLHAVPVGEGIIDYASFFSALREIRYDGWVTYEICSSIRGGGSLENLDKVARHFIDWMLGRQPG
ncbi:MAG TPA: sugar phosphate isomerase/epimerase family protein [Armatimonadota bacterium]|nr:sugar phosphate isomerase/epimerase family protein [Armatimonadota bacterium]